MALMGKCACIWHAYNSLHEPGKGSVPHGQLKVLTHNLASSVGLSDADCQALLISVEPVSNFNEYSTFLKDALFSRIPASVLQPSSPNNGRVNNSHSLERIDEVCWMICSKSYSGDGNENSIIKQNELYKLWRIFNALAELSDETSAGDRNGYEGEAAIPVAMDPEEMDVVVRRLAAILKIPHLPSSAKSDCEYGDEPITFAKFYNFVENRCLIGRDEHVTSAAIGELFDETVANVLKKGYLARIRGTLSVPGSQEQSWYVLTPDFLRVYSRRDEKEKRNEIPVSKSWRVENISDRSGIAIAGIGLGIGTKTNRFAIHMADGSKSIELCAPDVQTKSEWIQAFQQAVGWDGPSSSTYGAELDRRRRIRAERRARIRREEAQKAAEMEKMAQALKDLEAEKKAREEAELRLQEEARQRELEQQRIRELEELQRQLEALLDAERQAKKDEETVKELQARVLREELEKKAELEKIRAELERLLAEEQSKSGELEERRRQQEALYQQEKERLESLEAERLKHDEEYKIASEKLQEAERAKNRLRIELERREIDVRVNRGLAVRFNRAEPGSMDNDDSPFSPLPGEIISHRGRGAFTPAEFEIRRNRNNSGSLSSSPPSNHTLVSMASSTSDDVKDSKSSPELSSEMSLPSSCSDVVAPPISGRKVPPPPLPRRLRPSLSERTETGSDGCM